MKLVKNQKMFLMIPLPGMMDLVLEMMKIVNMKILIHGGSFIVTPSMITLTSTLKTK